MADGARAAREAAAIPALTLTVQRIEDAASSRGGEPSEEGQTSSGGAETEQQEPFITPDRVALARATLSGLQISPNAELSALMAAAAHALARLAPGRQLALHEIRGLIIAAGQHNCPSRDEH